MRFIVRTLALICLAVAVIFIVVDATRTIGAGVLQLTPVAQSWDALAPGMRDTFGNWLSTAVHPMLKEPVLATVASWPTFAVFAFLFVLLSVLARPTRRRLTRFGD